MSAFEISSLNSQLTLFVLIFIRSFFMLITDVIIGSNFVPVKFRLMLALTLSYIVLPLVHAPLTVQIFSIDGLTLALIQALIGIIIAGVFQCIFQITLFGGQLIAAQSGLGFAQLADPNSNVAVSVISVFYYLTAVLLFLSLNGHLMIIQLLVNSFDNISLSTTLFFSPHMNDLLNFTSIIFSGGISIALPAITALLITNIAFGVLTRNAPHLSLFNVGFSITVLVGFAIIFITFNSTMDNLQNIFRDGFTVLQKALGITPT